MINSTCTVDGCDRPARSGKAQWCNTHYFRWYRTGDTGSAEIWNRERHQCTSPDCDRPAVGQGLCSRHHQRLRAHGDPQHVTPVLARERHGCWKGQDVGYGAAHERVRAARGSASGYRCAHCGGRAQHWAYDHADPDVRQSDNGPYSTSIEHYLPLCVSCHKCFDLGIAGTR